MSVPAGGQSDVVSDIRATAIGPGEYGVTVVEGDLTTHHRVTVPTELLDELDWPDLDTRTLVEQSFAFLLEREKPTQILPEFGLDQISRYFPDYLTEIRARLSG